MRDSNTHNIGLLGRKIAGPEENPGKEVASLKADAKYHVPGQCCSFRVQGLISVCSMPISDRGFTYPYHILLGLSIQLQSPSSIHAKKSTGIPEVKVGVYLIDSGNFAFDF